MSRLKLPSASTGAVRDCTTAEESLSAMVPALVVSVRP